MPLFLNRNKDGSTLATWKGEYTGKEESEDSENKRRTEVEISKRPSGFVKHRWLIYD